jgi:hypothetical protein
MTYKDGDEFEDGGKPATHKTADPIAVLGPKSQPDPIPPDPPEAIAPGGEEAAERMPNPPPLPDPSTFQNYPGSGHDDPLPEPKAVVLEEEEEEEEEKTEGDYIKLKEEDEDEDEKEEDGEGEEDDTEEGVEVAKKPTPAPVRKPASPPARRR